jgi:ubiquinone/menaquinone biosynthesis C-methylase UbiE
MQDPEGKGPAGERTHRAHVFWEQSADWNIHRAIADAPGVREDATRERAFDESGANDARDLAAFLRPDARVLDLGCGIGRIMRPLAPLCREIVGVDISEKMVEQGREYLAGVPNARLVRTGGAELPTVADGSIDFLYSLICLIHVDKRTAFRYLREIQRVLAPEGLALLQFENLLAPEGLAEFQRVVDLPHEYPLEFYTRDEVRALARAAGFEVLHFREARQFLFATLLRGSPEAWIRAIAEGVSVRPTEAHGVFAGEPGGEGRVVAEARSTLARPFALVLHAARVERDRPERCAWRLAGQVLLQPGVRHRLELVQTADGKAHARMDGRELPLSACERGEAREGGALALMASLTPPGFANAPDTARLFPALYPSLPVPS